MNIDDLNPQNTNVSGNNQETAVPAGSNQAQEIISNQVQMAANGMSPFGNPPVSEPVVQQPQASYSPVEQAIPTESQTIATPEPEPEVIGFQPSLVIEDPDAPKPAPVPEPAVVDNTQVPPVAINTQQGALPPYPAPTTVDNAGLPPLPEQNVVPINTQEVTVVNTAKKRSGSNFILIVLILLLALFVVNIDTVINYVQTNILSTNPTDPGETSNNNLVEGYIKIEDSTSDYTLKEIRFYNFKKQPDFKLLFNYTSPKNYSKVSDLGIYIEIYDSNKELLSKYLFDEESVGNSEVGSSILNLGEDVYKHAYFAKPVIYSEAELGKETSVTCTYNDSNENYLLEYKTKYLFKNNELTGYEVNKKIEVINNNKATSNAINIISKENSDVTKFEIATVFENNVLTYNVNLNNVNEGYIPFYSKGTTPTIIKMNETAKKWICE